ncbi:hypothetical protein [Rhodococcoides corynebacterioides]|uniref:Uncharacterized protein n=1 Tax=Rhodococcoides corynebacterioides TaxID=53972 RepID=A0ABS7P2Y6_9NOCA|nr:hypothetical protein [Rhodococcus corynebacterioides]MBY6366416.1 hypothetical protein [Rhodococcus corynebacterioides]MBY6407016.1 hypothetical protein [Rhodococcus corynebacterioides]
MSTSTTEQIVLSVQRSTPRLWLAAAAGALILAVLYAVLPLAGVEYPAARPVPGPVAGGASRLLSVIDVTSVLVVVAALTVVSIVRTLPYGIGAVLMLCPGAPLTAAAARSWLPDSVLASAHPDGRIVAVASLVAAASLVVSPRVRPAVLGLGLAATVAVAAAAVVTAAASVVGVLGALAVTGTWWALAAVVMAHSPIAARREHKNPLDTAALKLRR